VESILGGQQDQASGYLATVSGGSFNLSSGLLGSITGGCSNVAGPDTVSINSACEDTTNDQGDSDSLTGGAGNEASGNWSPSALASAGWPVAWRARSGAVPATSLTGTRTRAWED
jgi:hypothetical protein